MSTLKTEIASAVAKKVGIPKEQATQAVDVVFDMLKKQLPPAVSAQLDAVLAGNVNLSDGIGLDDAAGLLGSLLGGNKNK